MYTFGIEFSTQSVKLVVLDLYHFDVVYTGSFDYDTTFPPYNTQGGVLPSEDPAIRHTSPCLLIEALDFAFQKLKNEHVDLSRISSVKTDCMQHCSVYTDKFFESTIRALDPKLGLMEQLSSCITRKSSPIWEDRSTFEQTEYLTASLKSKNGINSLTGNRAEFRFPCSQILKWGKESPEDYERTSNIFVLSAFITSILAGQTAPVDTGDGWGTNINSLDIDNPGWNRDVLSVSDAYMKNYGIKSSLGDKIGRMDHYDATVGTINSYFSIKYGINSGAIILAGTGDNPATLLGSGGSIVISLGSSYTVNGVMEEIIPSSSEEYNIFGYTKGRAMALSVFTNGSKVHDAFLQKYIQKQNRKKPDQTDWDTYIKVAGSFHLSTGEKLMLPYLLDESVPLRKRGVVRDGFSEDDAHANIRALHISQVLSLKLHSSHLGEVDEVCVVGGGSKNSFLMQLIADTFKAETNSIVNPDMAAPMGCAISGAVAVLKISYDEAAQRFVQKDETSYYRPIKGNRKLIHTLIGRYKKLEDNTLKPVPNTRQPPDRAFTRLG